jgi:hypothetical protein
MELMLQSPANPQLQRQSPQKNLLKSHQKNP